MEKRPFAPEIPQIDKGLAEEHDRHHDKGHDKGRDGLGEDVEGVSDHEKPVEEPPSQPVAEGGGDGTAFGGGGFVLQEEDDRKNHAENEYQINAKFKM